jgi:prolyl-tRNA synthetase
MPVLLPADYWKRSGRYGIDELFKLKDRKGADMVLAMTHEEIVTTHVSQVVRSYRDLPLILYHFSIKERDEPRPRAGVLRTREFVMKDSYSFDRDLDGMEESYAKHILAYDRIFDRCGLRWYRVESDVGMMGGVGAHEYMAPCAAGENEVALAEGYAANVEIATADAQPVEFPPPLDAPEAVDTPGQTTVEAVAQSLGVPAGALLKAFPVQVEGRGLVTAMVRGDHRIAEIKLQNALKAPFRSAQPDEVADAIGPGGFIGPVNATVPILLDDAVQTDVGYITGANEPDRHLRGVQPGRDFEFERANIRRVEPGDTVHGRAITIEPAIEIGNIFKLGTRYTDVFGAKYLDESGVEQPIQMGSYGIGPARIAAAAIEQFSDEQGIAWPRALAPFDVELVGLGKDGSEERDVADRLYDELREAGLDVIYDDRDAGPGEKFADAELLGCPVRVTLGRRSLENGELEAQIRRGQEARTLPLEGAAEAVAELWRNAP